jgi:hypothetical protein
MIHTEVPNAVTVIVNDEVHQFVVELAHLVMRCLRVLLSFATFTTSPGGGGRRPVLGARDDIRLHWQRLSA